LYKQLVPEDPEQDIKKLTKEWKQILSMASNQVFRGEKDGKLVFRAIWPIIPNLTRLHPAFSRCRERGDSRNYRKQGLGMRVMNAALDFARSRNCYKVML